MFAIPILFSKSTTPQKTIHINSSAKNATLIQQTKVANHLYKKSKNIVKRQITDTLFLKPLSGFTDLEPIQLNNPLTTNPLMSLFTTLIAGEYATIMLKLPKFKSFQYKIPQMRIPKPVPLSDPFHNRMILENMTKIWDG